VIVFEKDRRDISSTIMVTANAWWGRPEDQRIGVISEHTRTFFQAAETIKPKCIREKPRADKY
jgi:hypothetical protein